MHSTLCMESPWRPSGTCAKIFRVDLHSLLLACSTTASRTNSTSPVHISSLLLFCIALNLLFFFFFFIRLGTSVQGWTLLGRYTYTYKNNNHIVTRDKIHPSSPHPSATVTYLRRHLTCRSLSLSLSRPHASLSFVPTKKLVRIINLLFWVAP